MHKRQHGRARRSHALHDAAVVERVREDQHACAVAVCVDEDGYHGGVCGETHAHRDGSVLAQELGHAPLELEVHCDCAHLGARRAGARAIRVDAREHSRRADLVAAAEAKVVVRAEVEAAQIAPRHLQLAALWAEHTLLDKHVPAGLACDRPLKRVGQPAEEAPLVQVLAPALEGRAAAVGQRGGGTAGDWPARVGCQMPAEQPLEHVEE
mmetsp:Transcript_36580/g.91222  ORF Transcript_36580/g.91222 Transcript_36580/m.91222 type:complete len:210 (-) Transcript_36580:342-971(-)